ncbi:MAG: hypothetical protein IIX44_07965, partial [Clostridia bacterium]|nr:hypothetical protein [Clostridia bacterium]
IADLEVKLEAAEWNSISKKQKTTISTDDVRIKRIILGAPDTNLSITPITDIQDYCEDTKGEMEYDHRFNIKYYGDFYVNSRMQCHLPPFRVKNINNNEELMKAGLFLFSNKMAILRLSLPIDDEDSTPIYDNDYDRFIIEISNPCDLPFFPKNNSVDAVAEAYIRSLLSWGKFEKIALGGSIEHVMLSDFDLSPDNIDGISDELKKSLFRMSVAPIQKRPEVSWLEDANLYLKENAAVKNGMMYIASTWGKTVSIIDKGALHFIQEELTEQDNSSDPRVFAFENMRLNVEFSVFCLLLRRMNCFFTESLILRKKRSYDEIQKQYNGNIIYLSYIQAGAFGTARDQLAFFTEKSKYLIDESSIKERLSSMEAIINIDKNKRDMRFQDLISVGGLLFTCVFGLPAIKETLELLRGLLSCIEYNIPILTINNCSFGVWILMIIILLVITLNSKSKK